MRIWTLYFLSGCTLHYNILHALRITGRNKKNMAPRFVNWGVIVAIKNGGEMFPPPKTHKSYCQQEAFLEHLICVIKIEVFLLYNIVIIYYLSLYHWRRYQRHPCNTSRIRLYPCYSFIE